MAFGKQLKEILDQRGMSVTGFAKISGIPKATLYSYIRRDSEKPNVDVYIALSQIGIDVDALLGNSDSKRIGEIPSATQTIEEPPIMAEPLFDLTDPNVKILLELTPAELQRVADFARGLIAARSNR